MSDTAQRRPDPHRNAKLGVLAVLIAVAAFVVWHQAQPATLLPGLSAPAGTAQDAAALRLLGEPDPGLHLEYLAAARDVRYPGALRNLFAPAPVAAGSDAMAAPTAMHGHAGDAPTLPAGPPPPAPIPLKFYGYATQAGAAKRVFLQMGDDIFVVGEGQIVAHRYQIVRIDKASVSVEDLQDQRTEVLPLIVS